MPLWWCIYIFRFDVSKSKVLVYIQKLLYWSYMILWFLLCIHETILLLRHSAAGETVIVWDCCTVLAWWQVLAVRAVCTETVKKYIVVSHDQVIKNACVNSGVIFQWHLLFYMLHDFPSKNGTYNRKLGQFHCVYACDIQWYTFHYRCQGGLTKYTQIGPIFWNGLQNYVYHTPCGRPPLI